MQLLQDVFIVENLQVLTEGKTNPTMKIKGIFGRCNEKNNNGRIYPTAVLEGQLNKVQPMINERRLCGELDHPQNDTVKLSNASHLITKLEMKGDELIGEAELLNTPAGLTAKALVEGGVKIGISSRGMGTLSEDAKGQKIVNEDFRLVTFDLVADPSTRGAFPGLSESTESKFVQESQDKLKKESNFITMIEARLRDSYSPYIEEAKSKKKAKKKGGFPDLNKDGEITKADVLVGRGVIPGPKGKKKKGMMEAVKEEGSWHQIAFALADAFGLVSEGEVKRRNKREKNKEMGRFPKTPPRELADREVHDHGSNAETVGRFRGVKKKKGAKMDEDYTMSKKQREDAYRASVRQAERGPQGGKARRDRKALMAHVEYQKIGDMMAEAFGLAEAKMLRGEVVNTRRRRTGKLVRAGRMTDTEGRKADMRAQARADQMKAKGVLRSHTEYQKIGDMMAEALGLVSEADYSKDPGEVRKRRFKRVTALEKGGRMSRGKAAEMKKEARLKSTAAEDKRKKAHETEVKRDEDKFKKKGRKR